MSIETFDVGTLIGGKYRLVEWLGSGGMGQVWKAEDIKHGRRPVAIKFIAWQTRGEDLEKRERLWQEMRALARLKHPNTVQLIEFTETADGTPYLVMEYIPGGSLKDRLASGGLDASTRRRVLEELCDALDYIHDQNIVHRDLKPSNILFDAAGYIRIGDFGLAKLVDSTYAVSIVAGTPGFEAPEHTGAAVAAELAQGRVPKIDHRADIYALGVIAWLLFTGQHPDAPTPLPEGTLSPELEQVLRKAMARDREDRYDSAGEFLEAIISLVPSPCETGEVAHLSHLLVLCQDKSLSSYERGQALENFSMALFEPWFDVDPNLRSETGEIDLWLERNTTAPFWTDYGAIAIAECKNRSEGYPVTSAEVSVLIDKCINAGSQLGFLVSLGPFTRDTLKKIRDQNVRRQGLNSPLIVPVRRKDIEELIQSGARIEEWLRMLVRWARQDRKGFYNYGFKRQRRSVKKEELS